MSNVLALYFRSIFVGFSQPSMIIHNHLWHIFVFEYFLFVYHPLMLIDYHLWHIFVFKYYLFVCPWTDLFLKNEIILSLKNDSGLFVAFRAPGTGT